MDAQKYKDQLKEVRSEITKQQYQLEKRQDKLEIIADDVATCKLDLLNAGFVEVKYDYIMFRNCSIIFELCLFNYLEHKCLSFLSSRQPIMEETLRWT